MARVHDSSLKALGFAIDKPVCDLLALENSSSKISWAPPIKSTTMTSTITKSLLLCLALVTNIFPENIPVPVVTDRTPIEVSNRFGIPAESIVNDSGDFAFIGNGQNSVYYREKGGTALKRVLQAGDEVPGFPGSKADMISTPRLNNSGLLVFKVDFGQISGLSQGAILMYDGISLEKVVAGPDLIPGSPNTPYGRNLGLIGVSDQGTIAFTAPLAPSPTPPITTLFMKTWQGDALKIVGLGDPAPDSVGTLTTLSPNPSSFNHGGETLLFSGTIMGGSGGQGLFAATVGGARKVVANGDSNPVGGTFPSVSAGIVNYDGAAVFSASGALWVSLPNGTLARRVNSGDTLPAPVGGTVTANSLAVLSFTRQLDLIFTANITGSGTSTHGLFVASSDQAIRAVAYRTQPIPGPVDTTFNTFSAVSAFGQAISFRSSLNNGSSGIFQRTGQSPTVVIAMNGFLEPDALGTYGITSTSTRTTANGSVHFQSDILDGSADFAEYLSSTRLVSDANVLPEGTRTLLKNVRVTGKEDYLGFFAQKAGGAMSIAVHNLLTRVTKVVATDGYPSPMGGRYRIVNRAAVQINASGTVLVVANQFGGFRNGTQSIYVVDPNGGMFPIVTTQTPVLNGRTVTSLFVTGVTPQAINDSDQIAFRAGLINPSSTALMLWSPGTGLVKVLGTNETVQGLGTVSSISDYVVTDSGRVSFRAAFGGGSLGILSSAPDRSISKIVMPGDAGPDSTTFTSIGSPSYNDNGEAGFFATLSGGAGGGVFFGSTTTAPKAVALNGSTAPLSGTFTNMTASRGEVQINESGDAMFRAQVADGNAASGLFIRRGFGGTLQTLVAEGEPAPGTGTVFDAFSTSPNSFAGDLYSLAANGAVFFNGGYLKSGSRVNGMWRSSPEDQIEEALVNGAVDPAFGSGTVVTSIGQIPSWNSRGRVPIWARVSGGTFTDGIFLSVPVIGTLTSTGSQVSVIPMDQITGTTPVTIKFDSVTQAGESIVTTSTSGPALPGAFSPGTPPVYFNLSTTAVYSGQIEVCFNIAGITFPSGTPRLLHFENNIWADVTTSGPTNNVVCGTVSSLSPFTIAVDTTTSVSGRVLDPLGRPLRNTIVTLSNGADVQRNVLSSSLGYYTFDAVPRGSYTLRASSRRYRFNPIPVQLQEALTGIDFIGLE